MVLLAGGTPKIIKCEEKDGFKLSAKKLEKAISKKTKWLILNSPSNPTGAGYTKKEIEDLSKVLLKHKKIFILSDDIYEHIRYEGFNFFTIAQISKLKERAEAFKERRDFVVGSLNNIKGINCLTPNGAFYVFPSCKGLLNKKTKLKTDTEFVQKLLEKSMVAVVQGSAFGLDGYFRISYATSIENLKKAINRIKDFCDILNI